MRDTTTRFSALAHEYVSRQNCLSWVQNRRFVTEKGIPMDFDSQHPYLRDVLLDDAEEMSIAKAGQIGYTTTFFLKGIYYCVNFDYNVLYSTTIDRAMSDMVKQKFDPIIQRNPSLGQAMQSSEKGSDSVHQKQFGAGFFTIFGSNSASAPLSLSADILMHDEWDRSNVLLLPQFRSRLQFSQFKRLWRFGNPDRPPVVDGNNIWSYVERSDCKYWFVQCPECGEWQYIDWPDSFCFDREVYQCLKCHGEITDEARRDGLWIRKYSEPGRASGYWAPLWIAPWASAKYVITEERRGREEDGDPARFWIFIAAKGYAPSDDSIPEAVVRAAFIKGHPREVVRAMGIDQGVGRHYCMVGAPDGLHNLFVLPSFDAIAGYIRDHKIESVVIDGQPQVESARKLAEEFPGVVKLAFYPNEQRAPVALDVIRWQEKDCVVHISRTRALDDAITALRQQKTPIFSTGIEERLREFITHCGAMYAIIETDAKGNQTRRWENRGADHYVHAFVYFRTAVKRLVPVGLQLAAEWQEGEPTMEKREWVDDNQR